MTNLNNIEEGDEIEFEYNSVHTDGRVSKTGTVITAWGPDGEDTSFVRVECGADTHYDIDAGGVIKTKRDGRRFGTNATVTVIGTDEPEDDETDEDDELITEHERTETGVISLQIQREEDSQSWGYVVEEYDDAKGGFLAVAPKNFTEDTFDEVAAFLKSEYGLEVLDPGELEFNLVWEPGGKENTEEEDDGPGLKSFSTSRDIECVRCDYVGPMNIKKSKPTMDSKAKHECPECGMKKREKKSMIGGVVQ